MRKYTSWNVMLGITWSNLTWCQLASPRQSKLTRGDMAWQAAPSTWSWRAALHASVKTHEPTAHCSAHFFATAAFDWLQLFLYGLICGCFMNETACSLAIALYSRLDWVGAFKRLWKAQFHHKICRVWRLWPPEKTCWNGGELREKRKTNNWNLVEHWLLKTQTF